MVDGAQRIARREVATRLGLPARREPRRLLVPELVVGERPSTRALAVDDALPEPAVAAWGLAGYAPSAARIVGILVDVYG